jgi:RNA-directed DNA polymerase
MMSESRNSKGAIPDPIPEGSGRKPQDTGVGALDITAERDVDCREEAGLMELVVERGNMKAAYNRVVGNHGSGGVDGMSVTTLKGYLKSEWERIKQELLEDRYKPSPVRAVEIPKASGGMRKLGIPTVTDRLIGQALHQVLDPIFDKGFSESSYGFRRSRSAHQAVERAHGYASAGYEWVVDIDLEKFFDTVNHDVLMSLVARKVQDKRVLRLIRRYLQAGIMLDGLVEARAEGTPQGSPLSPLLSNIMLDELDKELERRGHRFVRYADDCNIYVRSERTGQRVMETITAYLSKRLRLRVNGEKSAVGRPSKRKFLGYSMTAGSAPRLRVSPQNEKRLKAKLRETFRKGRGRSLRRVIEELSPILRGWMNYFRLSEVKRPFEELDKWIRRKLRCLLWRQWKRTFTRFKKLVQRGLDEQRAWQYAGSRRGPWWNAGASHMNDAFRKDYFDKSGLVSLLDMFHSFRNQTRTAVYGTVRTVV